MSLPNPDIKFAKSKGVDLPIMQVYLVGRISGNCMEKCTEWRKKIIKHFKEYRLISGMEKCDRIGGCLKETFGIDTKCKCDNLNPTYESYPVAFISPLNSGESKTADALGLKSHIPSNLIFDKDMLSLKEAHIIVANLDDFMEYGIEDLMWDDNYQKSDDECFDFKSAFFRLKKTIENRRANYGSIFEVAIAMYLGKPVILIAGNEKHKYICENHPFLKRASVIVKDVDELLEQKWIQTLYKSMAGSEGE